MSIRACRWSGSLIKARLSQKSCPSLANRQYSSISSSLTPARLRVSGGKQISRLPSSHHSRTSLLHLPPHAPSIRFASTTPDPQPTLVAEPVLESSTAPTSGTLPNVQQVLDCSAVPPDVERHIGFLKELGLDFGWGPTSLVQWALEHVHVYAGTPWWVSVPLTLLAIRIVLFKAYTGSADAAARMLIINSHVKDIKDRLNDAKRAQDLPEMMRQSQEMKNVYLAAGIKPWKNFLPLLNLPLGYGFFRLSRSMTSLPVPGLDDGGILWITDLTLSDPLFMLPLATGVTTFLVFKAGGEMGSSAAMSPNLMRTFKWGLPILSAGFMSFWPALLQLGIVTTSIIALIQAHLFRQAWFRTFWNIHPLPPKDGPRTETEVKSGFKSMVIPTTAREVPQQPGALRGGVFGNARSKLKSTVSDLQERGQEFVQSKMQQDTGKTASRRSAAEIQKAKRYDEKRKKEIQQAKMHNPRRKHKGR